MSLHRIAELFQSALVSTGGLRLLFSPLTASCEQCCFVSWVWVPALLSVAGVTLAKLNFSGCLISHLSSGDGRTYFLGSM